MTRPSRSLPGRTRHRYRLGAGFGRGHLLGRRLQLDGRRGDRIDDDADLGLEA